MKSWDLKVWRDSWIENYERIINFVLKIKLKTLVQKMNFRFYYKPIWLQMYNFIKNLNLKVELLNIKSSIIL